MEDCPSILVLRTRIVIQLYSYTVILITRTNVNTNSNKKPNGGSSPKKSFDFSHTLIKKFKKSCSWTLN